MTQPTIAAVSTPRGTGGIAVIRISGPDAIAIADSAWTGKPLRQAASHTAHLGQYRSTDGHILDQAVATLFRAPNSFTGEDTVELSVHGSQWIQQQVLDDLMRRGAHPAGPGQFTQRAFLNGRIDLAQAEGIADLIAAQSKAAHALALRQTSGSFSRGLDQLREKLTDFAAMIELELDFSEEDVEFADRSALLALAGQTIGTIRRLIDSYHAGNAIVNGVPVVIAGIPNAGKSSLLNLLADDDKAIVTDIPGTTRDAIETTVTIDGILFRITDTAGLRDSDDTVEAMGIQRAREKMHKADTVIWIIEPAADMQRQLDECRTFARQHPDTKLIILNGKSDLHQPSATLPSTPSAPTTPPTPASSATPLPSPRAKGPTVYTNQDEGAASPLPDPIPFSAKTGQGLEALKRLLVDNAMQGHNPEDELMVTNARHYQSLISAQQSLARATDALQGGVSCDFVAQDIREAIHHLGAVTGAVTPSDLLTTIFSRFCIGK